MSKATLRLRELELRYRNGPPVLSLPEAAVERGEIVAMIGPNGGGKTTLLRTMAGLMPPYRGSVSIGERSLYGDGAMARRARAREMAVVLTGAIAPGYLRVEELVDLGRIPYHGLFAPGRKELPHRDGKRDAVALAMATVGVDHLAARRVGSLSDGERQRVLIARALAQEPRLMLLDEPGAHLDPPHQTQLFLLLHRLVSQNVIASATIATHNIHLALHFATKLFIVAEGSVLIGSPEALLDAGAVDRAFLSPGERHGSREEGVADLPPVRLDRSKGWFLPDG